MDWRRNQPRNGQKSVQSLCLHRIIDATVEDRIGPKDSNWKITDTDENMREKVYQDVQNWSQTKQQRESSLSASVPNIPSTDGVRTSSNNGHAAPTAVHGGYQLNGGATNGTVDSTLESQPYPMDLTVNREENTLTRSESMDSTGGEQPGFTSGSPQLDDRRTSDEGNDNGQNHWKKIMVSNIQLKREKK